MCNSTLLRTAVLSQQGWMCSNALLQTLTNIKQYEKHINNPILYFAIIYKFQLIMFTRNQRTWVFIETRSN